MMANILRSRLTVGQRILDPFIGVRIPAPQQARAFHTDRVAYLELIMDIEFPSLPESQKAFHSKMKAASFFVERIKEIYKPDSNLPKDPPNELFYYIDAGIFELHAASQILLQIINVKSHVNKGANEVNGGRIYQDL